MNQYTMMIVQWGSCNVDADLSTSTKEEVIEDNVVRMCKEFGNFFKVAFFFSSFLQPTFIGQNCFKIFFIFVPFSSKKKVFKLKLAGYRNPRDVE